MLPSKSSRSGYFDFWQKDRSSSIFPKICRGNPVVLDINKEALVPKKSYISVNSPKNQLDKLSDLQMSALEEEIRIDDKERNHVIKTNIQFLESNTTIDDMKSKNEPKRQMDLEICTAVKIEELEEEIERRKSAETKMFESLVSQTKKFEEVKIELEESKLEIMDLKKQVEQSQDWNGVRKIEHFDSAKAAFDSLKRDLARAKHEARESELKAKSLMEEMNALKNDLQSATSAEETSKKAMDDLALALKEVATEASQTKGKYLELEHVKSETDHLKEMIRETEDKFQKLLEESIKDSERHKNMAERLRMEAEDSLIAWNGKEKGFVECIRINEEHRARVQQENLKLKDSLKTAKAETAKMRDIMKQALNEANVAKVAAGIARDENSQLKDSLADKDEMMLFLKQENDRLTDELNRLLSKSRSTETDSDDTETTNTLDTDDSKPKEVLSFDLEKVAALKGSIFDTAETPKSEAHTPDLPLAAPQYRWSSTAGFPDDLDQFENSRLEDGDGKINHRRRKSALFRRFGDIILRKSNQK